MPKKKKQSPSANTTRHDRQTVEREFQEMIDYIRRDNIQAFLCADLSGAVLKRRKEATLAWLPKIQERYGERYPGLDLVLMWGDECSITGLTMGNMERIYHIALAAALWLLDELDQRKVLHDVLPLLEADSQKLEAVKLPDITDSRYSQRVIRGMVRLILGRDGIENPFRGWLNETSVKLTQTEPLTSVQLGEADLTELTDRERFRLILAQLPSASIHQAVNHFEEKMWEFLDTAFAGAAVYHNKLKDVERNIKRLNSELKSIKGDVPKMKKSMSGTMGQMPVGLPLAKQSAPVGIDWLRKPSETREKLKETILDMGGLFCEIQASETEAYRMDKKLNAVFRFAHMIFMENQGNLNMDVLSEEDVESLLSLSVDDPYEICFAFLYLVEQGSLLPWLYNAPMGVLMMAARQLPWNAFGGDFQKKAKTDCGDGEECGEQPSLELLQLDTLGTRDMQKKREMLYKLCYEDAPIYTPQESPRKNWKLNLPQLVYGITNVLMPRRIDAFGEMEEHFCQAGMDQGLARGMELYLQLAHNCGPRIDFPEQDPEEDSDREKSLHDQFAQERQEMEDKWREKQRELEIRLGELTDQLRRQQEYQVRLEAEKRVLREQMAETEKRCQDKLEEREGEVSYLKRSLKRPRDHDQIAAWVEKNFSDRLILHPRAVSLLSERSARSVDVGLICDALDFLATDYWERRYSGLSTQEMNNRCGEKYGRPFDVTPTGAVTIEYTPAQYKVKYFPGRNGSPAESPLDYHLGVGNDPENLLRIYFLHDDSKKLIVVGSLPRHLRAVTIR